MKKAVFSMDIEDWYHLDYFNSNQCDKNYSLLDGIDTYLEILEKYNIKSNFFLVGEIAYQIKSTIMTIKDQGHDIDSHGWNHVRPINMKLLDFKNDLLKTKGTLEDIIGENIKGYRAPCFSIDRPRLDIVKDVGHQYDSSRINFTSHPLYKTINMNSFRKIYKDIYEKDKFFEFQATTTRLFGKNIPISGGGYIRLLPWELSKKLVSNYLKKENIFVFYIHPFELSKKNNPLFPMNTKWYTKMRFKLGRSSVKNKIIKLIHLLKKEDYEFMTFSELRNHIIEK